MHGSILISMATNALVLKHQTISIHSADLRYIILHQFHTKLLHVLWKISENVVIFWEKKRQPSCLKFNAKKKNTNKCWEPYVPPGIPTNCSTAQRVSMSEIEWWYLFVTWNMCLFKSQQTFHMMMACFIAIRQVRLNWQTERLQSLIFYMKL